jgi:hypothetical protein
MSDNVVKLLPNNALCVDMQALAARVKAFGERLEAGEFGAIERVVILFEDADTVRRRTYGRPTSSMELVGLLEYAKNEVFNPTPEKD